MCVCVLGQFPRPRQNKIYISFGVSILYSLTFFCWFILKSQNIYSYPFKILHYMIDAYVICYHCDIFQGVWKIVPCCIFETPVVLAKYVGLTTLYYLLMHIRALFNFFLFFVFLVAVLILQHSITRTLFYTVYIYIQW